MDFGLCMYQSVVWSYFYISCTVPNESLSPPSRVSYFCTILQNSLITLLIILSLWSHNLNLFSCYVWSIFLHAFFCTDIKRDSVSLEVSFSYLCPCEISPVCRLKYLCSCFFFYFCFLVIILFVLILSALLLPQSVRQWPGRPGFNPRSSHTKDFKNGTWYHLA